MKKPNKIYKKLYLAILIFFILFGLVKYDKIKAQEVKNYYYDSIEVDVWINKDSTFDVVEKQTYNLSGSFGYFFRDIELKNLDHISGIEAFNSNGKKLDKDEYQLSYSGNKRHIQWNFPRRNFNNELKSWIVKYKVHGGLGFFENWDELYWNAIFQDREVPVKEFQITVRLPDEFRKEDIKLKAFFGFLGSKEESYNYTILDAKTVKFWGEDIEPENYFTIVVSWPKGAVQKPILYKNQLINLIVLFIGLALPIFIFFKFYFIWRKKGKDPKIKKTIIAQYSPFDNLAPALSGVLIRQNIIIKDIIATVVDLAVRGYLKIKEEENRTVFIKSKEYIFEKIKDESDLRPFEQKIIKSIFSESKNIISSSDLKNKFYKKIPGIQKAIYEEVEKTGFFTGNLQKIRKKYRKISIILFVILIISFFASSIILGALSLIERYFVYLVISGASIGISAIIGGVFAYFMPALTGKGLEAKWQISGSKEYLKVAERFRIGVETLETFSKFLPYAMVFGVEKQWANRFSDFEYKEQSWYLFTYIAGSNRMGSVGDFSSSFSSFASSVSSIFNSSPGGGSGMGGGGGAGGGGGGGGGGAG